MKKSVYRCRCGMVYIEDDDVYQKLTAKNVPFTVTKCVFCDST